RCEDTTVGPDARLDGRHDLIGGPATQPCAVVGRKVWANENPQPGHLEADVRPAQEPGHVRLPEKMTGRVAVGASVKLHEILPPCHLRSCCLDATPNRICRCTCRYRDCCQHDSRSSHLNLQLLTGDYLG